MNQYLTKPELMSPAGHWPQLKTAIEAGADAVYFGLNHFSARAKVGFSLEELPRVMDTLHERAVKGFVTFNTLVFDHELALAEKAIVEIASANVDAVIVQDVGMAKLIQQIAPNLDIHGSTQMSVTSAEGAELARSLGCSRVVLGRELSLTDIRRIAGQTDVELEVFVHGALCVSYSGQCFSSEAWGGRSANRGKCAQACRLSYDLIVDGELRDLGPYRYLLSPGDLYALEQIPQLVDIGISCLKIEGRYKDSEYVALTTRAYREAIDLAVAKVPNEIDSSEQKELEQIYSRGLGPHFMSGTDHQQVVRGRAPRHRGMKVGTVKHVFKNFIAIDACETIKPGDGLVFDAADWRSPDEPEEGGNVYGVEPLANGQIKIEFGRNEIDFSRIREGDWVWRSKDPKLTKRLKPITTAQQPLYTRPLWFEVKAELGAPIEIHAKDEFGTSGSFVGDAALEPAQKRQLDLETLETKLGRLGGSPFHLQFVAFSNEAPVFVPTSVLNQARREIVQTILSKRKERPQPAISIVASQQPATGVEAKQGVETANQLHILVRSADQLDAAIECRPDSITLDYLELYGLRPSVEKIKAAGLTARVASPRILKPSEQNIVRFLLSLESEILIRSGGLLQGLRQSDRSLPPLVGDFSLNAANTMAFETYLEMGLDKITPTYDLNAQQIQELTSSLEPSRLEVIAYSHLPVFHTEHCVFCRFLSEGTDNTNCGHPCEKHQVAVKDNNGRMHPVMADVGCRNTVFGAEAQCDVAALAKWQSAGIKHFRVEFVHQTPDQVREVCGAFRDYFHHELAVDQAVDQLGKRLATSSPQGTTKGSLFVPKDFKNLVQLS